MKPDEVMFEAGIWGPCRGARPKAAAGVEDHLRDWENDHHPGSESEEFEGYALCGECGSLRWIYSDPESDYLPWFTHWCCLEFTKSSIQREVLSHHERQASPNMCGDDYDTWIKVFRLDSGRGWGLLWVERRSDDWTTSWDWYSAVLPSMDSLLYEVQGATQDGLILNDLRLLAALGEE